MNIHAFFERSQLRQVLWGFRREFMVAGIFSAVSNLLLLTPTIYMLQIYDRVMVSGSQLTLLAVSLICLFLYGVMAMSDWTRSRILVRTGVRLDEALGTRVFNASFEAYLDSSGVNPQRAFSDLLVVRQFLTGSSLFALFDAPWAPIYVIVVFFLHPFMGWIALGLMLVQIAMAYFGHRHTIAPAEAASRAGIDVNIYVQGKLRNAEVLESMGMVDNLRRRWRARQAKALDKQLDSQHINSKVTGFSKFVRYSQQSLALGAGAIMVIRGEMSPGGMIASNVLMNRALAPIDALVTNWRSFQTARAAFERLEKLLEEYPERDPALHRVPPDGEITLRDVFATVPGRQSPILKNINFTVPAGKVVAVLGPSGSGKSTLARVMMGIWPNVAGEVLLDGLPITGWNRAELGPHLGYLPQDIELFDGTIADNIARFADVNSDQVIEAATAAGLHQMILRFPMGYDTGIGESGGALSGGQRQRIALARAMYGDPKLIVLDEPNANLDDVGEAALMKSVEQLKAKGKTVFLITHRQSAIAAADWLMVLKDGELVHCGERDAVIAALNNASRAPRPAEPGTSLVAQPA
ncbi:MAG TPA: type I secretion system permease/ATPase [Ramlibacter sp.]|nr:type I secretion system permease/ATPase [Ramlibacter sp.]